MKALFELQARVLLRWSTGKSEGLLYFPLIAAALILAGSSRGELLEFSFVVAILLSGFALTMAMLGTLDAMEAATASRPLRRGAVLRAHVLFWTAAWLLYGGILALLSIGPPDADGALVRAVTVLGTGLAGWVLVVHEARRRGCAGFWILSVLLFLPFLPGAVVLLTFQTAFRHYHGDDGPDPFFVGLPSMAIQLAVGTFLFLRQDAAGRPGDAAARPTTGVPPLPATTSAEGKSTAASIFRGTFLTLRAIPWFVMGFLGPMFPGGPEWDAFVVGYLCICVVNVALASLGSWRWLAAMPIPRARAFRILFTPYLVVLLLGLVVRGAVVEVQDRTVLYERRWMSSDGFGVALVPVNRAFGSTGQRLESDPGDVAVRVEEHLSVRFGLTGTGERVRTAVHGRWRDPGPNAQREERDEAVTAALDRVRDAFLPELRAAIRRRMAVDLLATLVLGALLLAGMLLLRPPWKGLAWFLLFLPLILSVLPTVGLGSRPGAIAFRDGVYAAFSAAPIPWSLAALAGAALLLRAGFAGFRRLEFDALPPATAKDIVR